MLAEDGFIDTKLAVAKHKDTPQEALAKLSLDSNLLVKETVLQNPNLPSIAMKVLYKCNNTTLNKLIASHPNTTPELLQDMAFDQNNLDVLKNIANNPNTPEEISTELLKDSSLRLNKGFIHSKKGKILIALLFVGLAMGSVWYVQNKKASITKESQQDITKRELKELQKEIDNLPENGEEE
jgi:hypothetical protein